MKLETFFEKFDQFADAPNAVAKMRELVFQLAVQGRLVQQDRTEESATVLLKRIHAARAALPTNRRSIEETDTTELEEQSTPFGAPSGWTWTSLGNVQVFTNGYAFKSEDYQSSGVGIIRMGELGANGEIDERNMKYVTSDIARSLPETFRVKPGDLLMGMSGSIGKLAINRSDNTYLLNQRVGRLAPILIEKAFLHVFLKTVEQHYLRISFGMAIKNLSTKQINETPFPLPPLAEQKRIVAKVDELMALCDQLEAQQQERETRHASLARASLARFAEAPTPANLPFLFHPSYAIRPADIRKSILTLAVQGKLVPQDPNDEPAASLISQIAEEKRRLVAARIIRDKDEAAPISDDELPFEVPHGWEWTRLSSITRRIHYGYTASAKSELKDVRLLRITDIQNNFVDWPSVPGCEIAKDEVAQYQLERSDILVARTGGTVGKTYLVQEVPVVAVFASYLIRIQGGTALFDSYLKLFLESPTYWVQLEEGARGAAQPNVNGQTLGRMVVSLPPLAEQRRIVAKVEQLMTLVDALETQLAASRATAANLLFALVAELTGNPDSDKVLTENASRKAPRQQAVHTQP